MHRLPPAVRLPFPGGSAEVTQDGADAPPR